MTAHEVVAALIGMLVWLAYEHVRERRRDRWPGRDRFRGEACTMLSAPHSRRVAA
jgi:hypothetical protein